VALRKMMARFANQRTVLDVVRVRRGANNSQMVIVAKVAIKKPSLIATSSFISVSIQQEYLF
jgi:hypothetical protein